MRPLLRQPELKKQWKWLSVSIAESNSIRINQCGVRITDTNNILSIGGGEFEVDTPFHQRWLDLAKTKEDAGSHLLDIGCAWGINTKRALSVGASVIATDIEAAHLAGLINSISSTEQLSRLFVHVGAFPYDLDLPANSIRGVLLSQIVHYLTAEEVFATLKNSYTWLKPDGQLILMAISPFSPSYQNFQETLQVETSSGLERWNEIEDSSAKTPNADELLPLQKQLTKEAERRKIRFGGANHPQAKVLVDSALKHSGFEIEKSNYYGIKASNRYQYRSDENGEYIGILAKKKILRKKKKDS